MSDSAVAGGGGGDHDEWEIIHDEYEAIWVRDRDKQHRITENSTWVGDVSQWVREIGWTQHFERKDKVDIYEASLTPRDTTGAAVDPQLMPLGGIFDRVIGRCRYRM
jgi:hypothetical protein